MFYMQMRAFLLFRPRIDNLSVFRNAHRSLATSR
jgi:hypothetical protein